MLHIGSNFC